MFDKLTKAQKTVMEVLCTMTQSVMKAEDIKPPTLGFLAAKGLVNVLDGNVYATCIFSWNMHYNRDDMPNISLQCMKDIRERLAVGMRIGAIKALREHTGFGLKDSVEWKNINFPK